MRYVCVFEINLFWLLGRSSDAENCPDPPKNMPNWATVACFMLPLYYIPYNFTTRIIDTFVFKNELRLNIKPLTRGYNTVADRWPGATTPPCAQPHMATDTLFLHAHFPFF